MIVAVRRLNQSINDDKGIDSDKCHDRQVTELLERLRHCRCTTNNDERFVGVQQSASTHPNYTQVTVALTDNATCRRSDELPQLCLTQIEDSPLSTRSEISSRPSTAAQVETIYSVAIATTTMSPALLMVDRCPRPAFDSPATSTTGSSAFVQYHQHTTSAPTIAVDQSLQAFENGLCYGSAASVLPANDITASETTPTSTPMLLRSVATLPVSLPVTAVSSVMSHATLPLHDALSRFRVYRRSGVVPAAVTVASSPVTTSAASAKIGQSSSMRCLVKMCDSQQTDVASSNLFFRSSVQSMSNAPDDEVRNLLGTGSLSAADGDRQKLNAWPTEAFEPSAFSFKESRSDRNLNQHAVDDDDNMALELSVNSHRHEDDINEVDDEYNESDTNWLDCPIGTPLTPDGREHWKPTVRVQSVVAAAVSATASPSTCVQRPSLDFDKMQRTCFRRQRVHHGGIRKPRIITLKTSGWSTSPIKMSSAAFNPAIFSFRSLSTVKPSSSSRRSTDDRNGLRSAVAAADPILPASP